MLDLDQVLSMFGVADYGVVAEEIEAGSVTALPPLPPPIVLEESAVVETVAVEEEVVQ